MSISVTGLSQLGGIIALDLAQPPTLFTSRHTRDHVQTASDLGRGQGCCGLIPCPGPSWPPRELRESKAWHTCSRSGRQGATGLLWRSTSKPHTLVSQMMNVMPESPNNVPTLSAPAVGWRISAILHPPTDKPGLIHETGTRIPLGKERFLLGQRTWYNLCRCRVLAGAEAP